MAKALVRADEFLTTFTSPHSLADDLLDAGALSARVQLAYFDALIIVVALRAGATLRLIPVAIETDSTGDSQTA